MTGSFDPLDPATLQDPQPRLARLRAEGPVHYVERLDAWFVVRHELVVEALRRPEVFSSQFPKSVLPLSADDQRRIAEAMADGLPRPKTMITADGDVHTRYRRLVSKAFSPRAIAVLEPTVRAITTKLIDAWIDRDRIEVVEDFAVPLPVEVIARALNVPDDRLADFRRWSDATVLTFGATPTVDERVAAIRTVQELQRFFVAAIEERRARPQDDLLTGLLDARIDADDDVDDKRPLDVPEIVSLVQELLVGGNETTTKLIAEMVRLFADHPDRWAAVRANPDLIPAVVEESLRLASPAQAMWRLTTEDVELGGVAIPAGSRVVLSYASANRDEDLFTEPDAFEPERANLTDHLAFGRGPHFCIGSGLARLEARVAFEELARRVRVMTLSDTNDFPYNPSFLLRGLERLDVDIVAA
ncbi:MAG: cytochrome P450 [Acidimicrobiales bacterium]|nr:cytochrome P450 [Acidimicrobiales bacterium]